MGYLHTLLAIFLWIVPASLTVKATSEIICHCPDGWVGHGKSCYHFSHDKESMVVASLVCKNMGGHLVEINTAAENAYLFEQIKHKGLGDFWIGANDIQEENIWRWYPSDTMPKYLRFTKWYPGEPNNVGGNENCVVMTTGQGVWYDHPCYNVRNFICEHERE